MDRVLGDLQPGLGTTAITGELTLTKTGTTARTATFPDAVITVAGSAAALTSGLIPQAGTGGILSDSGLGTSAITGILTLTKTGTTARTVTFPDAAIMVARTDAAQTFTGLQSFDTLTATGQISSTLATGTAPLVVASTTVVANLNASLLGGATFAAPGSIGGTTPGSGSFTTISATGAITSTLATGSAPFVVASTTVVANLNASLLNGTTWTAPGAIGGTTPSAGAFDFLEIIKTLSDTAASGPNIAFHNATSTRYSLIQQGTEDMQLWVYESGAQTFRKALSLHNTTAAATFYSGVSCTTLTASDKLILSTPIAAPTTAGSIAIESGQEEGYLYSKGLGGWITKSIYMQYADTVVTGVQTDVTLSNASAKGTRTIPANWFKTGSVIRFHLSGYYNTDAAPGNATIALKFGAVTLRSTASFTLDASVTNGYWEFKGCIVCKVTGTSPTGQLDVATTFLHAEAAGGGALPLHSEPVTSVASVAVDTTASGAIDVVWTATDAGTSIHCCCFELEAMG